MATIKELTHVAKVLYEQMKSEAANTRALLNPYNHLVQLLDSHGIDSNSVESASTFWMLLKNPEAFFAEAVMPPKWARKRTWASGIQSLEMLLTYCRDHHMIESIEWQELSSICETYRKKFTNAAKKEQREQKKQLVEVDVEVEDRNAAEGDEVSGVSVLQESDLVQHRSDSIVSPVAITLLQRLIEVETDNVKRILLSHIVELLT
jgi:hypothetical protein